jgi:hypothetical protein
MHIWGVHKVQKWLHIHMPCCAPGTRFYLQVCRRVAEEVEARAALIFVGALGVYCDRTVSHGQRIALVMINSIFLIFRIFATKHMQLIENRSAEGNIIQKMCCAALNSVPPEWDG